MNKTMNLKPCRIAITGTAGVLTIMLCGCGTPPTHYVDYNLNTHVTRASARDKMKPNETGTGVAVVCLGPRSESRDIVRVSAHHCENPLPKERFLGGFFHVLQAPEPIGKFIEQSATAALTSTGIRNDLQSPKKLLLQLERFDYDEISDRPKTGFLPWLPAMEGDGVVRKGFLDVVVKVAEADGTISYQRRVSAEVSRKRGQMSSGVLIAAVVIAQVSPITLNPDAVRAKEEKTVTADVFADLFAKFQDELVADEDLLRAIRK